MACNCGGSSSICIQCSAGLPCNCPPDYSVLPQPVDCHCCPSGYTYIGITPNFPNGYCCPDNSLTCDVRDAVAVIPCNTCINSIGSECVFITSECFGLKNYPLNAFVEYLCSDAFTLKMLQNIGLSTTLKAALCEIVSICPSVGSTVPIPGPLIITIP